MDECLHSWVGGMIYVHDEDLESVARERAEWGGTVECEKCDAIYVPDGD